MPRKPHGPAPEYVERINKAWFRRHSAKYQFHAQASIARPSPDNVDRQVFGQFICAPFPVLRIARWGFLTATARDLFCKRYGGKPC